MRTPRTTIAEIERSDSIRRARQSACRRVGHEWSQPHQEIGCPRPPKRCLRCGAPEASFVEEAGRAVRV